MDFNDEVALHHAEARLTDRERIALGGYLLFQGTIKGADVLAYSASRPTPPKANMELLQKKASAWLASDACRSFMALWKGKAQKEGAEMADEDNNETERMLEDLNALMAEAENVEDKIKIIKIKADIRHKNKAELQTESTAVSFFLPQRCNARECPLYDEAMQRLRAKGNKDLKNKLNDNGQ